MFYLPLMDKLQPNIQILFEPSILSMMVGSIFLHVKNARVEP
jgi:hypothetical protein